MRVLLATLITFPSILAADGGGGDSPPPTPVNTCKGSEVYDDDKGECVDPKHSSLQRDELYLAVRQLAYASRYLDAQAVAQAMPKNDPGRLTYMGFTHRKLGNFDLATAYYNRAIEIDPTNILARSYMGQGFVEAGRLAEAMAQLELIHQYGGAGTWSDISLRTAIATGATYNY